MTPQCKQQSVMLAKFLNRLGQHPPPFLLKLHEEEIHVSKLIGCSYYVVYYMTCTFSVEKEKQDILIFVTI